MSRVYNFSAGPSVLPESALIKARDELLDFGGSGMSVMEMSHRSKQYQAIFDETEATLRELMHIPQDYAVLFLQNEGLYAEVLRLNLTDILQRRLGTAESIVHPQSSGGHLFTKTHKSAAYTDDKE